MRSDVATNEATRWHESGHIAVALDLGCEILDVEIGARDADGGLTRFARSLRPDEMLRIVIAGPLAERGVHVPLRLAPWSTDGRLAREALAGILGEPPWRPAWEYPEFRRAAAWAHDTLSREMNFLTDLVALLSWRPRIDGEEIERLWREHERDAERWRPRSGAWR